MDIEIISNIFVIHHVLAYPRCIHPCNKIFKISRNCKTDYIWTCTIKKLPTYLLNLPIKAGSLTMSVPTLTCPCSINCVAFFKFWAIFDLTRITGSLRRQKLEALTLSHSSKFHLVGISPMEYNFSRKAALISVRC